VARFFVVSGLLIAAIAAGVELNGGKSNPSASTALAAKPAKPRQIAPPGPIPGYLLIADRGNNRMLLVDSAHHIFWRYPGGGGHVMPFVFDDDTFFGPRHNVIISNQEDQDTIQVISFPGKHVLWRYGHVDVKSGAPGYLNTPDDAYLLPNGLVSVADAYNCRVIFISKAHRIVQQYGTTGVCRHDPPRYLGAVNGATPLADGGTLVSEINGSWIDDIGPNGNLRWSVQAPVGYPSDPQLLAPNRILLADYSHPGGAIIMTRAGRVLWRYRVTSGPGELDHPSLATRIAPGLIAINDDYRHRVVIVSIKTHRIVWQYGHTDQPGTADGYLHTPDGLDVLPTADAQRFRQLLAVHKPLRSVRAPLGVTSPFSLPAPVEREVAVLHGGAVLLAGGLDAAQQSTSGVFRLAGGHVTQLGSLPQVVHDAAGAVIGNGLYVFGGGAATSSSAVQRFDLSTHTARVVAHLPRPLSDLAAAQTPDGVFLVGGYDGVSARPEIYRTRDGVRFTVVARLPLGLRYAAVTSLGHTVFIAGGNGSRRVFALNTSTGRLRSLGSLPAVVAGGAAFTAGGVPYVAQGSIYRLAPIRRVAGSLPAAYAGSAGPWVIGGERGGQATASVFHVAARG
jgi:hypothetical protein